MLGNISIKVKLIALSILLVFSFLLILIIELVAINKVDSLAKIDSDVKILEIKALELRKHEKDFLSRKDLKYLEKFDKTMNSINELKNIIDIEFDEFDLDKTNLESYNKIMDDYSTVFKKVVEIQKLIGLTHEDGLYGKLRNSVHKVQEFAKKSNDDYLLATVYDLRKQEKDFMLRVDEQYVEKFNKIISKLIKDERYSNLHPILKDYQTDFVNLVSAEKEKGFDEKSGLMKEMRNTVHQFDEELEKLTHSIEEKVVNLHDKIELYSLLFISAIALLITISLIYISRVINK